MQYIDDLKNNSGGCVFCEIQQSRDEKKTLLLFRGKNVFVIMNRYPYNNGHLLIIPYKHTGNLSDLGGDEYSEMMHLCSLSMDILKRSIEAEGFNCGMNLGRLAGAGITEHVHLHVVPRWLGDTNFFPILSNTKSMLEYLEATYDRIIGGFKEIKI